MLWMVCQLLKLIVKGTRVSGLFQCQIRYAFVHAWLSSIDAHYRPANSPDLGRRLSAFSLHCRLSSFEVHFTGEIENMLAFFL